MLEINPLKKYRIVNCSNDRDLSDKDQQLCLPGKFSGRPPLKPGESVVIRGEEITAQLYETAIKFGEKGFWVKVEAYVPKNKENREKDASKESALLEAKAQEVAPEEPKVLEPEVPEREEPQGEVVEASEEVPEEEPQEEVSAQDLNETSLEAEPVKKAKKKKKKTAKEE